MSDDSKPIQKPWAVYGVISKFIGRIVEENSSSVGIQYREGQLFSLRYWDSNYDRFDTSKEAINYLLSTSKEYYKKSLTENVMEDFPEAIKKEQIQWLRNTLVSYLSLLSQSSP